MILTGDSLSGGMRTKGIHKRERKITRARSFGKFLSVDIICIYFHFSYKISSGSEIFTASSIDPASTKSAGIKFTLSKMSKYCNRQKFGVDNLRYVSDTS